MSRCIIVYTTPFFEGGGEQRPTDLWFWASLFATMLASVFGVATPWVCADVQAAAWGMQHVPGPLFMPAVLVAVLPAFVRAVATDCYRRELVQERHQRSYE